VSLCLGRCVCCVYAVYKYACSAFMHPTCITFYVSTFYVHPTCIHSTPYLCVHPMCIHSTSYLCVYPMCVHPMCIHSTSYILCAYTLHPTCVYILLKNYVNFLMCILTVSLYLLHVYPLCCCNQEKAKIKGQGINKHVTK